MIVSAETGVRRKILDVTRQLLIKHGIANVSMRMISGKVGCSVGNIYFYFKNKDELVHSLIEEGFDKIIKTLRKVEADISDPLERLKALCYAYIDFGLKNPEYYEIMYLLKTERMARYPVEKYRKALQSMDIFVLALTQGTEKEILKADDPYLSANLLWAFMHGVISLFFSRRLDHRLDPQVLADETIHKIIKSLQK